MIQIWKRIKITRLSFKKLSIKQRKITSKDLVNFRLCWLFMGLISWTGVRSCWHREKFIILVTNLLFSQTKNKPRISTTIICVRHGSSTPEATIFAGFKFHMESFPRDWYALRMTPSYGRTPSLATEKKMAIKMKKWYFGRLWELKIECYPFMKWTIKHI